MNSADAAAWFDLGRAAAERPERMGFKAARLAELRLAGFLVPDGWVLPADRIDSIEFADAARELVALRPSTPAWILRSSSPWEDRPEQSAAGLFLSEICGPSIHEIARGMERVLASRHSEHVRRLLGEEAPLALLAQPLLDLDAWWTVELRTGLMPRSEGWSRGETRDPPPELLRELQQAQDDEALLVELGAERGRCYVLQCRPAPRDALPAPAAMSVMPEAIDETLWSWDREHSARPLCPLLAGYFERWLGSQSEPPSKLIHGCWHDRVTRVATQWNESARARLFELETLKRRLGEVETAAAVDRWDVRSWREFMERWLNFQSAYFDRPTAAARRWLRSQTLEEGALGATVSARNAELDELARRLVEGEAIDWDSFLERHGHQADWPWDGRGRSWAEEPARLRRELELRGRRPPAARRADSTPTSSGRVMALLEEDDELLARSYDLFRRAVRGASLDSGISPLRWEDSLELDPRRWESLLDDFDSATWEAAVAEGRERARSWLGQALLRAARGGGALVGTPVFPGRVRAALRVLPAACAGGGPDWGDLLVVPAIQPADAVVFGRLAGLVVEAGDPLGHAAVLAREARVPCLVGVEAACARLAAESFATLDARAGFVEPWRPGAATGIR